MRRRTGARAVCDALEALAVRLVFAYPGTEILELLEGLRGSTVRTIVPTSELGGTFMALGYARASGRVGVTAVIPGPGLAFSLAGLAEARFDSVPLLVLTGEDDRHAPFELDRAVAPVVKAVLRPEGGRELAAAVHEAHDVAAAGEPGPVIVRLPPAALAGSAPRAPSPERTAVEPPLPWGAVESVAERIADAQRVVLLLGQGASAAAAEAVELAERLAAAVLATTSGRGIVPESHPRSLVVDSPGHGAESVNRLLADVDFVLALGCRYNPNGTLGGRLALDPARLVTVDAGAGDGRGPGGTRVQADVRRFLRALLDVLPAESSAGWRPDDLERWRHTLAAARTAAARTEPRLSGAADPSPAGFLAALRRALPPDGVLVTDSGLHQQLARRHFQVLRPRTLLVPADFQSMGFGLPAAIGASLAEPERPVVALVGDGGVAISGLELLTAVREGVGLTVVVFNDGRLNLIRLQQLLRFGREHGVTHRAPDLEALARAVGARYLRLEGEPDRALSDSIGSGELWLLEVVVEDTVWLRRLGALGSVRRLVRSRQG